MFETIKIPSIGFLREKIVLKIIPVCKSTLWAGVKSGMYPKPYKLSANTTAWCVQEILALIERIKAERK